MTVPYANASGYCWEIHNSPKLGGSHVADEEALENCLQVVLRTLE